MLIELPYDRERAVAYARRWALSRNPLFTDFTGRGGNCTNFVSQCVLAGGGVMNFTPTYGWYYVSEEDRAPAWSGVQEFYRFMTGAPEFVRENGGTGPYAVVAAESSQVEIGDAIQLSNREGVFYHSLLISEITEDDVLVCAQSDDALDRPLSTYRYAGLRVLHFEGVRIRLDSLPDYQNLIDGISLSPQEGEV